MERYEYEVLEGNTEYSAEVRFIPATYGDWVRWEDVAEMLAENSALRSRINALNEYCTEYGL